MPKIRKKSPIHGNADANITCDFGDGDISRAPAILEVDCHTHTHGQTDSHIASSIIVKFLHIHAALLLQNKLDIIFCVSLYGVTVQCICVK